MTDSGAPKSWKCSGSSDGSMPNPQNRKKFANVTMAKLRVQSAGFSPSAASTSRTLAFSAIDHPSVSYTYGMVR